MSAAGNSFIYFIRILRLALGGFLIIGTIQLQLKHQKEFGVRTGEAIAYYQQLAVDGIPTIPSDHTGPEYEGQFVHMQGELDTGTITDPLTGMTLHAGHPATALRRTVEMWQWQEVRTGTQTTAQSIFTPQWSESLIDSDSFIQRDLFKGQVHQNPKQLPHETGVLFKSSSSMLGAWPLELSYTDLLAKETGVGFESLSTVTDGWQVSNGYVIPTDPDANNHVGAFRILYTQRNLADGQYSAIGLIKDGVLSRPWFGNIQFALPLLAWGNFSAEVLVEQAILKLGEGHIPSRSWMFYVFVGLLLCIGVLARFFPQFKSFTESPFPRRAVITIVIAAVGTILVGTIL